MARVPSFPCCPLPRCKSSGDFVVLLLLVWLCVLYPCLSHTHSRTNQHKITSSNHLCRYEVPTSTSEDDDLRTAVPTEFPGQFNPWHASRTAQLSYSYAAAVLLAVRHFNARNGTVVPELLDELMQDCTVYFPEDVQFADSQSDGAASVQAVWDAVVRRNGSNSTAATNNNDTASQQQQHYCAMLGPLEEETNLLLQPALAALDIPLMVHYVESDKLSSTTSGSASSGSGSSNSPSSSSRGSAATSSLTATGRARGVVDFLQDTGRPYLAHWFPTPDAQAQAVARELERIAASNRLRVSLFREPTAPPGVDPDDLARQQLERIQASGITTVYLSIREPYEAPRLAGLLDELDMLSSEYLFVLPPSVVLLETFNEVYGAQVVGSPLDKLLSGAISFDRMDLFDVVAAAEGGDGKDDAGRQHRRDPFLASWRDQGEDLVSELNRLVPLPGLRADPDYFQVVRPWRGSSFV